MAAARRLNQSTLAPLVVIVGETASGKSALALALAKKFNGEIICADSWTVYKGFDIGTAKPTQAERASIRHHLLDVADPTLGFSAPQFQRLALVAIADIASRGRLPIMVGGTGLYIDSVIYDYSFLPASDASERARLNSLTLAELLAIASERRLPLATIDARNKRRVIRLIENNGAMPTKKDLRANTLLLGIKLPPEELQDRIINRIDAMVETGFVGEIQRLGEKYGWDIEPMRAPGYRAFTDYVNQKISLDAAKERFMRNDLQLAKKQRTWFKRNKSIQWLDNRDRLAQAVALMTTFLHK